MAVAKPKKIRIGDLLVEHGVISAVQLAEALEIQKKTGQKLGRVLQETNAVTEDQLLGFLAHQLNIDYIDLENYDIKPEVVQLIPEVLARRLRVIALDSIADELLIGMSDPTDIFAFDEVARFVNRPLRYAVVRESDLFQAFDHIYRRATEIRGFAEELNQQLSGNDEFVSGRDIGNVSADAPVVKLLEKLFEDAVHVNASDIHIEPEEDILRIRFRIDGVLRVQSTTEARIGGALISRLKLMAALDISEKRLPQDGRFHIRVKDMNIDVRVSTLPLHAGESAVLRLLNQSAGIQALEDLGVPDSIATRFRRITQVPHGMLLVVGPTGSGKTTTLYSTLKEINTPSVKIITVEDPVEYRLPNINQVQVNAKIDLSFARVLRTILRQDPDIILVGEMRDHETIETGLRAAMTGHLVFSTLHTNDTVSTAVRLVDMGAPPYLLAAALRGILAQRLVRRLCDHCAATVTPSSVELTLLQDSLGIDPGEIEFRRGQGCKHCNDTGYKGRIGVYEFLEMKGDLVDSLRSGDLNAFAKAASAQEGFRSLKHSALHLAARGLTSFEEVLRVSCDLED